MRLKNSGEFESVTTIDGIRIQIKGYIVIRDISIHDVKGGDA